MSRENGNCVKSLLKFHVMTIFSWAVVVVPVSVCLVSGCCSQIIVVNICVILVVCCGGVAYLISELTWHCWHNWHHADGDMIWWHDSPGWQRSHFNKYFIINTFFDWFHPQREIPRNGIMCWAKKLNLIFQSFGPSHYFHWMRYIKIQFFKPLTPREHKKKSF